VKKTLLSVFLLFLLVACSSPDYRDLAGNQGNFADLHGKWVLINYWAIWCQPCRREIPELNALSTEQAASIVVFGVNFDSLSIEDLRQQSDTVGIEFAVLREDPSVLLGYPRPEVLPTTYLFDPRGKLVRTLQGPQTRTSIIALTQESR